jgi:lipoyl(octanoyl) transferase
VNAPPVRRLRVRRLGLREYRPVWQAMRRFTEQRTPQTSDEVWLLEHSPVFTLGQAAKREHLLAPGSIPVIRVDRGGQVTYHGPGQLVVYLLLELRPLGIGVRGLVTRLEQAVIALLQAYGIAAESRRDAPGVYVSGRKIAALGLRVRRGCTLHGLALNVDMDLEPFSRINPCGYPGLDVTQVGQLGGPRDLHRLAQELLPVLGRALGYTFIDDQELRLPDE